MSKKKWALLVVCAALLFGYIKLFYKSYTVSVVTKSADCVIAVDVKRITNTLIWNIITTPSQWKISNIFSSSTNKEVSWQDMVAIPDYILAFHVSNQPVNIFYVLLPIKDENTFAKGVLQYHFLKQSDGIYTSKEMGISFFKQGDKIVVTNTITTNDNYLAQVANELFVKKEYITKEILAKVITAKSHVAISIAANNFLQQDMVVTANFTATKIEISSTITPNKMYAFAENNFSYSSGSLFTAGFTQPSIAVYNLISDSSKSKISKLLTINIDSVFLQSNKYYTIDLQAIKPRTDSAITYNYDDDFNKVEKVVVNNIQEPAFNFIATGNSINTIYNYFLRTNKIEQTDIGQLFIAMPLVKSYCNVKNQQLNITAANYLLQPLDKNTNCIFFLNLSVIKIPANLLKYLPTDVLKVSSNIESVYLKINKKNNALIFNCTINKKTTIYQYFNYNEH